MHAMSTHFKVGDMVQWDSQSSGYVRHKIGTIVAVVPPKCDPDSFIPEGLCSNSQFGFARKHTSYLVRVGNSGLVYWPRVKNLGLLPAKVEGLIVNPTVADDVTACIRSALDEIYTLITAVRMNLANLRWEPAHAELTQVELLANQTARKIYAKVREDSNGK